MRHSFPELTRFITSPLARGIAYTLSRSASSEGACITVCPDGYSFIEAQGAFAIAGAMVLAPELAAGGPAGVAVEASIAAIGSLMLFAGDAGRQQAADDLAEEWSHSKGSEGEYEANFKTEDLLDSHYNKHRNEFGDITKEEYLQKANELINSKGDDILTKTRKNGDTIYYNEVTNEFAVKTKEGFLRTFFKPKDGIGYFNRQ